MPNLSHGHPLTTIETIGLDKEALAGDRFLFVIQGDSESRTSFKTTHQGEYPRFRE